MSAEIDHTVSVLVPCYNAQAYLPQALDSALAQTHRPSQIIVVDDGSTDNSAAVVHRYVQANPDRGITLIQQANAGEPAARNTGIGAAQAAWIAMLDADDWWEPTKLQMQLAAADQAGSQCVLVHTGVVHHFPDGRTEPKDLQGPARRTGWCTEMLLEPTSIGHPSIMVRRDAMTRIGGYNPQFSQACDIDLYFRLSAVGTFAFVPQHLLHYRMHDAQMSTSQVDQIAYHHLAVRRFFAAHRELHERIGPDRVQAALARHVAVKLESLYWRRRLDDFRQLLTYARSHELDSAQIRAWRRRGRVPRWLIHLRDRITGAAHNSAGQPSDVGTPA